MADDLDKLVHFFAGGHTPASGPAPLTFKNGGCFAGTEGQARLKVMAERAMVKMSAAWEVDEAKHAALKQLLGDASYRRILPYIARKSRPAWR